LDQSMREAVRHPRFFSDDLRRIERRLASPFPGQCAASQLADLRQPRGGIFHHLRVMPQHLSVSEVVAFAAPGIEQPRALARLAVEQLARGGKALRSARDALARRSDDRCAGWRRDHRSFLSIWPIGIEGTWSVICCNSPSRL